MALSPEDLSNARAEWEKERVNERRAFLLARRTENYYGRRLRRVAGYIGDLVEDFARNITLEQYPINTQALERHLTKYAQDLTPWAEATAERMLREVAQRDATAWNRTARRINVGIANAVQNAPIGETLRQELRNQVHLIRSLPLEAAQRVHDIAVGNIYGEETGIGYVNLTTGERQQGFKSLIDRIEETGLVTRNRAILIARTETSRVASTLTAVRAQHAGITHFTWRTQGDGAVRKSHKEMNGQKFAFYPPPEVEPGERYLPGQIYNCFPGNTKVHLSQGIRRIFRAPYNGEMITLLTGNSSIFVTPNHPMLTNRGWLPAKAIHSGDQLVPVHSGIISNKNTSVSFENLYTALGGDVGTRYMGVNFHGDHVINDQVDIVSIDDNLPGHDVSEFFERISEFAFANPDCGVICSWIESGNLKIGSPFETGCLNDILARFERGIFKAQQIGLASAARRNIDAIQYCNNGPSGTAKFLGQSQDGHSCNVFINDGLFREVLSAARASRPRYYNPASADELAKNIGVSSHGGSRIFEQPSRLNDINRVVDTVVGNFSGHVYTLETMTGYYGIGRGAAIAKNCRCYIDPFIEGMD